MLYVRKQEDTRSVAFGCATDKQREAGGSHVKSPQLLHTVKLVCFRKVAVTLFLQRQVNCVSALFGAEQVVNSGFFSAAAINTSDRDTVQ